MHEVVSHLERVPQVARQMWEKGESTRVCTEDDYVAKAVADMVEIIYLYSCRHGIRSLFIYVTTCMVEINWL